MNGVFNSVAALAFLAMAGTSLDNSQPKAGIDTVKSAETMPPPPNPFRQQP
jgi:hypothetical protein